MSHTPGPWKHHEDAVWSEHESVSGKVTKYERTNHVCAVSPRLRMPERERLDNARLIASAPDLLAICQRLQNSINGLNATMRAAITTYRHSTLCQELNSLIRDNSAAIAKATGSEPTHGN